jgi:hypothetical protein
MMSSSTIYNNIGSIYLDTPVRSTLKGMPYRATLYYNNLKSKEELPLRVCPIGEGNIKREEDYPLGST